MDKPCPSTETTLSIELLIMRHFEKNDYKSKRNLKILRLFLTILPSVSEKLG